MIWLYSIGVCLLFFISFSSPLEQILEISNDNEINFEAIIVLLFMMMVFGRGLIDLIVQMLSLIRSV